MKLVVRSRPRKSGKEFIYLDYYHQGKRRQIPLGLSFNPRNPKEKKHQLEIAERIRIKKLTEFENEEFDFLDTSKRDNYLIPFIESFSTKQEYYNNMLKYLKKYSKSHKRFREIDEVWLRGFKEYLLTKTELHNNSAAFYFGKFRELLSKASKEGYIKRAIIENVKNIKRIESKREYLTIDEIRKLTETPFDDQELKRAFLFSCFTGLRQVDIRQLKWSDIVNSEIKLRQKKTKDFVIIPLSSTAKLLLYKNVDKNITKDFIFKIGKDRATINRKLTRWFGYAKVQKTGNYHISRHSYITMLITLGTDIYTVSKLAGHKDIKTTLRYANLVDEKRKEAINKLPDIKLEL